MTFDDRNFDSWTKSLEIFDKYGAHVTFFPCGEMDDETLEKCKMLHNKGHSIGIHGLTHRRIPELMRRKFNWYVYHSELSPQIDGLESVGIKATSFAYPFNDSTEDSDKFLLQYVDRLRVGVHSGYYTNGVSIVELDDVFYACSNAMNETKFNSIGVGEYYATDLNDLLKGIKRISEKDELLVLFSHSIDDAARGINMKTQWLELILAFAQSNKVQCLSFDELNWKK